ncbi:metal-sulfur cluster assembly factor [Chloroflexi bacterium TSY]|nr:metal-sulfur cluster assembly factor [Chloroflexi bacterium TSY]
MTESTIQDLRDEQNRLDDRPKETSVDEPVDNNHAALTEEIGWAALKTVIDPEIFQNIVDLGLVYGLDVKEDNHVDVTMTLTTPHCPMGPQIIEDVEQTLVEHGARAVQVNIVWDPMWTPDAMTDELKRELGILDEEFGIEEEDPFEEEYIPEPPQPKKKGLLSRLFGW